MYIHVFIPFFIFLDALIYKNERGSGSNSASSSVDNDERRSGSLDGWVHRGHRHRLVGNAERQTGSSSSNSDSHSTEVDERSADSGSDSMENDGRRSGGVYGRRHRGHRHHLVGNVERQTGSSSYFNSDSTDVDERIVDASSLEKLLHDIQLILRDRRLIVSSGRGRGRSMSLSSSEEDSSSESHSHSSEADDMQARNESGSFEDDDVQSNISARETGSDSGSHSESSEEQSGVNRLNTSDFKKSILI